MKQLVLFVSLFAAVTARSAVIEISPRIQSVAPGGSVSFSISPAPTTGAMVLWKHNGTVMAGQSGAVLTLGNVQTSDSGYYSAIVTTATSAQSSRPGYL